MRFPVRFATGRDSTSNSHSAHPHRWIGSSGICVTVTRKAKHGHGSVLARQAPELLNGTRFFVDRGQQLSEEFVGKVQPASLSVIGQVANRIDHLIQPST
ncbi:hypothetical protein [Muricoccus radiodurans]|uniref:hypothetical protein n=1 Tax=Muricoccus radiodurans TaxID=2231721 RepID=UPI003CFA52F3